MKLDLELRRAIIRSCKRMDHKNWVANHDGNISVKTSENRFVATPTARSKGDLSEEDLIDVDEEGTVLIGSSKIFSEFSLHRMIYSSRADVQAVVHAHPPNATAVACTYQEMATTPLSEAVVSLGPCVPLAIIDSDLIDLAHFYDAAMVAHNGIFAWGVSLEQAFLRLELVEHLASIFLKAAPLGGPKPVSQTLLRELLLKREKAGLMRPADPNRPVFR